MKIPKYEREMIETMPDCNRLICGLDVNCSICGLLVISEKDKNGDFINLAQNKHGDIIHFECMKNELSKKRVK